MELYKKEKVNPMGGCLPVLITMPVFCGLLYVLEYSLELRHASFLLDPRPQCAPIRTSSCRSSTPS